MRIKKSYNDFLYFIFMNSIIFLSLLLIPASATIDAFLRLPLKLSLTLLMHLMNLTRLFSCSSPKLLIFPSIVWQGHKLRKVAEKHLGFPKIFEYFSILCKTPLFSSFLLRHRASQLQCWQLSEEGLQMILLIQFQPFWHWSWFRTG